MINSYVKSPNLLDQLHNDRDSWGECEDILWRMLELAKSKKLHYVSGFYEGMDNLYQAMNESLVLLAWKDEDDVTLPVLGYQPVRLGDIKFFSDSLFTVGRLVLDEFRANKMANIDFINMDSHYNDPFSHYVSPQQMGVMGKVTSIRTPVEVWESYARQHMDYSEYLKTDYWKQRRYSIIINYNERCALCNRREFLNLHIHHRTYKRRGHEFDSDLTALCRDCHNMFHKHLEVSND